MVELYHIEHLPCDYGVTSEQDVEEVEAAFQPNPISSIRAQDESESSTTNNKEESNKAKTFVPCLDPVQIPTWQVDCLW